MSLAQEVAALHLAPAGLLNDPRRDQLVRGGDGLLAITIVVGRDQLELFAEHAAPGVEVGDRNAARPIRTSA